MKGEFVIRIGSAIITYKTFDEIPLEFDNLISFKPDAPEPPHTEEDHKEMEKLFSWNLLIMLKKILIFIERNLS